MDRKLSNVLEKLDKLWIGLLIGLIFPWFVFFGYYFTKFRHMGLGKFFNYLLDGNILTPVVSLCVIINLGIFFLFIKNDKYYVSRGIIFATFIYAFGVLISKLNTLF